MKATAGIDEMDGHARILSREGICLAENPLACRLSAVPPVNEAETPDRQRAFPYEGKVVLCFSLKSGEPDEVGRWISAEIPPQPAESKQSERA